MTIYTPNNIPNQSFSVKEEGADIRIRLHVFKDILYADVFVDNECVMCSYRVVNKGWLLPFPWMRRNGIGNLRFEDGDLQYPDYRNFGTTCNLVYYTAEEAENL